MLETQNELDVQKNKDAVFIKATFTQEDIVQAIQACLKVSPLINPEKTMINSVFMILKGLYMENKKYAIIEAPTGSGKTIIGFMLYFCIQFLNNRKMKNGEDVARPTFSTPLAYLLTSNKMLQSQIDADLDRFDFREYIAILKGTDNYSCLKEKDCSYKDRPCKGMSKVKRQESLLFAECDNVCPYQIAREEASFAGCTVLNYAYFLNVMRSLFKPFFNTREITIADEAHLLPDIVCNIFNFEFNQFMINQTIKLLQELELNYGSTAQLSVSKELVTSCFSYFNNPLNSISPIGSYYARIEELRKGLGFLGDEKYLGYSKRIETTKERIDEFLATKDDYYELLKRPKDVYFESELVADDRANNIKVYKHTVKDLAEATMVQNNFLSKIHDGIFMSATLGDLDEYAELMGIKKEEYVGLRLPSTFDFSKSPIFICNSGWLNYQNFNSNIDKVVMDCIKICNQYHPNEKGIIHTSTFNISKLLKEKIELGLVPDKSRFLFYNNAEEKEQCVNLMKNSTKPYVICGPSLYEGLDLKDDQGRFNIMIKVPYAQMSDYIKKKIERFPFWYKRNTLEKIVQGLGRTNRWTNDYSTCYLLDSCFDKIIYDTNESIVSRLQYKKLY